MYFVLEYYKIMFKYIINCLKIWLTNDVLHALIILYILISIYIEYKTHLHTWVYLMIINQIITMNTISNKSIWLIYIIQGESVVIFTTLFRLGNVLSQCWINRYIRNLGDTQVSCPTLVMHIICISHYFFKTKQITFLQYLRFRMMFFTLGTI
jgi:hypothetical protein